MIVLLAIAVPVIGILIAVALMLVIFHRYGAGDHDRSWREIGTTAREAYAAFREDTVLFLCFLAVIGIAIGLLVSMATNGMEEKQACKKADGVFIAAPNWHRTSMVCVSETKYKEAQDAFASAVINTKKEK